MQRLRTALILASIISSPIHGQRQSTRTNTNQQDARPEPGSTTPIPGVSPVHQDATSPNTNQPNDHPGSYFSRLASPDNLPNLLLFAVGVGGVYVAICTLKIIERQTKAAEDAATAAKDGAEATRQSVEAAREAHAAMVNRERARIRVEVVGDWEHDEAMAMVSVPYRVTCYGPTPAFIDSGTATAWAKNSPDYQSFRPNVSMLLPKILTPTELNGEARVMGRWPWTPAELESLMSGALFLILTGKICYRDVFGNSRETSFNLIRKTMEIEGLRDPLHHWVAFGPPDTNQET